MLLLYASMREYAPCRHAAADAIRRRADAAAMPARCQLADTRRHYVILHASQRRDTTLRHAAAPIYAIFSRYDAASFSLIFIDDLRRH